MPPLHLSRIIIVIDEHWVSTSQGETEEPPEKKERKERRHVQELQKQISQDVQRGLQQQQRIGHFESVIDMLCK